MGTRVTLGRVISSDPFPWGARRASLALFSLPRGTCPLPPRIAATSFVLCISETEKQRRGGEDPPSRHLPEANATTRQVVEASRLDLLSFPGASTGVNCLALKILTSFEEEEDAYFFLYVCIIHFLRLVSACHCDTGYYARLFVRQSRHCSSTHCQGIKARNVQRSSIILRH